MTTRTAGIDLGSIWSSAAYLEDGRPVLAADATGRTRTPAAVNVDEAGQVWTGPSSGQHPQGKVTEVCGLVSLLGTNWEIQRGGVTFSAEDLVARGLDAKRTDLERSSESFSVAYPVLAAPADFGLRRRHALGRAAVRAGLHSPRLTTSALLAAAAHVELTKLSGMHLVIVMGDTYSEAALVDLDADSSGYLCDLVAVESGQDLGLRVWEAAVADWICEEIQPPGHSMRDDPNTPAWLAAAARRTVRALCQAESTSVPLYDIGRARPLEVSRAELRARTQEADLAVTGMIERLVAAHGDPDHILMVGDGTALPNFRELVQSWSPHVGARRLNAGALAVGAALESSCLCGEGRTLFLDQRHLCLGLVNHAGATEPILPPGTPFPGECNVRLRPSHTGQDVMSLRLVEGEGRRMDVVFGVDLLIPPGAPDGEWRMNLTTDANGEISFTLTGPDASPTDYAVEPVGPVAAFDASTVPTDRMPLVVASTTSR